MSPTSEPRSRFALYPRICTSRSSRSKAPVVRAVIIRSLTLFSGGRALCKQHTRSAQDAERCVPLSNSRIYILASSKESSSTAI